MRAFTLVELMVSIALATAVGVLLLSVFTGSIGIWERAVGRMETQREAQAIFASAAEDLSQSGPVVSSHPWLFCEVIPASSINLGGSGPVTSESSVRLTFLTRARGEDDASQGVNALTYQIAYTDPRPGSSTPIYGLYRIPTTTRQFAGNVRASIPLDTPTPSNPSQFVAGNFLARQVIGFHAKFLIESDAGDLSTIAPEPGKAVSATDTGVWLGTTRAGRRVAGIEVQCVIVSAKSMNRLSTVATTLRDRLLMKEERPYGAFIPMPTSL